MSSSDFVNFIAYMSMQNPEQHLKGKKAQGVLLGFAEGMKKRFNVKQRR